MTGATQTVEPRVGARRFAGGRLSLADVPVILCLTVLVGLVLVGQNLAPYDPYAFDPDNMLLSPSWSHPFGTDEFGRDVLSRILAGARPTLSVALAAAVIGVGLGTTTGLVTGYAGGAADEAIMRVMDSLMSFPALILAMLVVVMLGGSALNVVVALGIVFWPRSARLVRSVVIELSQREFVDAARSRGERWYFILLRELLPNVQMFIILDFSLRFTSGILLAASLAYLGIGVAAPTPAWGLMVRDGQPFIEIAPWLIIFPCLAVTLTAMAVMMIGERLRARLDISSASSRTGMR